MRIVFKHTVAATLALTVGFLVAPLAGSAQPPRNPAKIAFDIPSQALSDALAEWSRQSGLQIFQLDGNGSQKLSSVKVSGTFSPAEALEKMLVATGLTYEFVNERTVRIAP